MSVSINTIAREFSPKEAAEITGVSVTLQRDWRRRKLLPERKAEGWSAFDLKDVIQIMAMRALSDSGISLSVAEEIASLSVLPTLGEFSHFPENFTFEGDSISDRLRDMVISNSVVGGSRGRYLLVPLPPVDNLLYHVRRGDDVAAMAEDLPNDCFQWLVLDHLVLAQRVMTAVSGPLYRIVAQNTP